MIRKTSLSIFLATCIFAAGCSVRQPRTNGDSSNRAYSSAAQPSPGRALRSTAKFVGSVVRIPDGDTIDVLNEQNVLSRVRLKGIDAPEQGQAFSNVARQSLVNLIAGKRVLVEWDKRDLYGRIVGKVSFDNKDICLEQIKAGLAWHFKRFEDEQSETDRLLYARAEDAARSQKLGLWREPNQIQPWLFRHHINGSDNKKSDDGQNQSPGNSADFTFRGNKRSKIYHWPGCPNYDDIAPHNRVPFRSAQEAEQAGYRAARNCP
jgi:endonuclease YncB( thermonuclease family)